jgi:hypothetical protein
MLGNFFRLTCPYLFDVEAIAYFAVLQNYHSTNATGAIGETTQILLNAYRYQDRLYVHPLKVQQRYSPTMYMLHAWDGDSFSPVTQSAATSEVLTSALHVGPDAAEWAHAVRVIDSSDLPEGAALHLNANTLKQKVVCYLGPPEA